MWKKVIKYCLIVFFFIIAANLMLKVVNADSGWDSSYDSGGSSWSSDSSSSSWGSSGSSSSGGSGITIIGGSPGLFVAFIIFLIIIEYIYNAKNAKRTISTNAHLYRELTSEEITQKDPSLDKEALKHQAFTIYKNVQIAWMNFDYDTLRKNLTDEIYNMYESQLKTLKLKNQQNIMRDITLHQAKIVSLEIENNIERIKMYLQVSQYDYVINKDKKVVRGTAQYKNRVEYLITIVRHMDNNKIDKCPNCGAPLDIVGGGVCPYCDSTIINNNQDFIMSKKECVGQCPEQ